MFIPTGWQDWELVVTALLYAWAALALASLFAFGVAYGLFREPHASIRTRTTPASNDSLSQVKDATVVVERQVPAAAAAAASEYASST